MVRLAAFCAFTLAVTAQSVAACSYVYDERTPDQVRAESAAVAVDAQCRVINGGAYDALTLRAAQPLGHGRFQQVVGDYDLSLVYVADCNTREATLLRGAGTLVGETSCGPSMDYADLVGENAMMSLSQGADLHELVAIAQTKGVTEMNPLTHFFTFTMNFEKEVHDVSAKDRFDLMCGCKRFYPDTPGAAD